MPDCSICNKHFSRPFTLRRHHETHSAERHGHKCDICGKTIKRLDLLKRHIRTHTGEGQVHCEHCSRGFGRRDQLESHQARCRILFETSIEEQADQVQCPQVAMALEWKEAGTSTIDRADDGAMLHKWQQPPRIVQMTGFTGQQVDDILQRRLDSSDDPRDLMSEIKDAFKQPGMKAIREIMATLPKPRSLAGLSAIWLDLSEEWGNYYYDNDYDYFNDVCVTLPDLAARYGHEEVMKAMIKAKFDLNSIDDYGRSTLHWAAEYDNAKIVELLLDNGADIESHGPIRGQAPVTALSVAAGANATKTIRLLIQRGAKTNVSYSTYERYVGYPLLSGTIHYGNKEAFNLLVDSCFHEFNERGRTALHVAAQGNDVGMLRALLQRGADANAFYDRFGEESTPLYLASREGKEQMIKPLLEYGASIDGYPGDYWRTPLMEAARWCQISSIEALVTAGADVNICRPYEKGGRSVTALATACGYFGENTISCLESLLHAGADANLGEITPLEIALKCREVKVVGWLLKAGADPARLPDKCRADLRFKVRDSSFKPDMADFDSDFERDRAYQIDPEAKLRLLEHYEQERNDNVLEASPVDFQHSLAPSL